MHPSDLKDRVIVVTGAGQGLGEQIATTLAAQGAAVAACDIKSAEVVQTVQVIQKSGGRAEAFTLDVTDDAMATRTMSAIRQQFGRIDVLVNNAGTDVTKPVEAMTLDEWDRVLRVNLRGPFVLTKAVYDEFRKRGSGHIVNIASTAAKRTWTEASAYHASKWGLLGFSHALHAEARRYGIKVTAVVAGGMRTPFIMERFPDTDPSVLQDPANVAEVVRFVLMQPGGTVIPEVMVLPMKETSWP